MSNQEQNPMILQPNPNSVQPSSQLSLINYDSHSGFINKGAELREYIHTLLKRKWWVIGTFLTVFSIVALYTFLRTPIYRTTATLQITQDSQASQISLDSKLSMFSDFDSLEKFQQTQYRILQSKSLAQRVFQTLNLKDGPDFKELKAANPEKTEAQLEDIMVQMIVTNLQVTPIKNSFLVEVAFQSPDKILAQKVTNAIADEYMYLSIDRRNESFALVRKWLNKQLIEMGGRVQEAQKKLYKFGQRTDIYTLDDKDNVVVQKFIDLSSLLTKAQAEKMAKEAQYQQVKQDGPDAPLIVNNPLVASLRQQLVSEQAKISSMQKIFRKDHPDLQAEMANLAELRNRLKAEVKRLQESIKADYTAANRTEKLLNDSFSEQKAQMAKLQDNLTDFQILKRDAQTNEQFYQSLLARVKEANIAGTMVPTNVVVIDAASLPERPAKPKTLRDLLLGGFLGLCLGIGLAFLTEHLDDSIKSVEDMERSCHLATFGMIPMIGTNGRKPLSRLAKIEQKGVLRYLPLRLRRGQAVVESEERDLIITKHPHSPVSEAIRHAHTAIMLSVSGRPPCAIMITSPNPSEGKTMIVSNLALTFALGGNKTVAIDCDLRRPRLHYSFGIASQPGLSNYLTGTASLEEIITSSPDNPNLYLIPAGTCPPNPGSLLNSKEFRDLLALLRQQFDHILIDTPPILGFSEARIISVMTDGVLLVVKHNSTLKSAGRLAHQLLSQIHAPLMGAVLNSVDAHGQAYGGYYYSDHYKYYSKYYDD